MRDQHTLSTEWPYCPWPHLYLRPEDHPSVRCLAARLVVILTRTNLADLLANVVRKLEALGGNQTLPLDLSRLAVVLRLRGSLLALGSQVSRVDVAVGEENGHAVLRLAARL